MAGILKLKNIFNFQREEPPSYKHGHYLTRLASDKLGEMLTYSESDVMLSMLPEFGAKKVLLINDGCHKYLYKKIGTTEAAHVVNFCLSEQGKNELANAFTIYGDLDRLPFKNLQFDLIICPFASMGHRYSPDLLAVFSKMLKNGGRMILSLKHPQFEHVLLNQNPAEVATTNNSVGAYFSLLKENNLFTEDLREGVVNQTLRPYFVGQDQTDFYHDYKGLPLTLIFKTVKFAK